MIPKLAELEAAAHEHHRNAALSLGQALEHYQDAQAHYWQLAQVAQTIQSSGLWLDAGFTLWRDYCSARMPVSDSRLRQLMSRLPHALAIEQHTGTLPIERTVREIPGDVDPNSDEFIVIYEEAVRFAEEKGTRPKRAHFEAVRQVVETAQATGGYVDVGNGEMLAFDSAVTTEIYERIQRQSEHIKQKAQPKREIFVTLAHEIVNGRGVLVAHLEDETVPIGLLLNQRFKLYVAHEIGKMERTA